MRRRDKVALGLLWGGLLAGLTWALSTQFRWGQENKPIQVQQPKPPETPAPSEPSGPVVIGTVGDDTITAMAKGLDSKPPDPPGAKPKRKDPKPPRDAQAR